MTPDDKRKIKAYEAAADLFRPVLPKVEESIYRGLIAIVDSLDTKAGRLDYSQSLTSELMKVEKLVADNLNSGAYARTFSDYVRMVPELAQLSATASSEKVPKRLLSTPKEVAIENAQALLAEPNMRVQFTNPLKLYMRSAVTNGGSVQQLKTALKRYVKGIEGDGGRLSSYVNTTALDTVRTLDGTLQQVIAEEFDLNAYEYQGTLLLDSRPQCVHWVKKRIILISEIPKEVERWKNSTGYGYGLGLTAQNWPSVCGGYGCRHQTKAIRAPKG
jgi:hypothetical protein